MEDKLYFKAACPKCNKHETFNILDVVNDQDSKYAECFISDEWREYYYDLFSVNSICKSCKRFVCGSVAAICDEVKNSSSELSDFALEDGEIVQSENLFINFDVPPLIPQQHFSSPPVADMSYLFKQAERCYDIHAWDAVVILCRKVIDIQSKKMWREKFETKPISNLCNRVYKILADGDNFDKEVPIEEQLDCLNENHKLLYDIEQIRHWGNFAAHSEICVHSDDAECAIIYTKSFIDAYYEWSRSLAKSKAEI